MHLSILYDNSDKVSYFSGDLSCLGDLVAFFFDVPIAKIKYDLSLQYRTIIS